jgi:uncharacterized membrane protein
MRKSAVYRLAIDAMMASLYFVFAFLASIRIGPNVNITPASLAIILVAVMYSPADALLVAIVGEMINQIARYGLTPTTALWLVPVILRALIISVVAHIFRRNDKYLEENIPAYLVTLAIAAIVTTVANTYVIYIDAQLFHYPDGLTLVQTILRLISGIITSSVMAFISIPLIKAVSKLDIGRTLTKSEIEEQKRMKEEALKEEEDSTNELETK